MRQALIILGIPYVIGAGLICLPIPKLLPIDAMLWGQMAIPLGGILLAAATSSFIAFVDWKGKAVTIAACALAAIIPLIRIMQVGLEPESITLVSVFAGILAVEGLSWRLRNVLSQARRSQIPPP